MAKDEPAEPKRRNRTLSVADAVSGALGPMLKKRGFASRDIITSWPVIAPPPYDAVTMPDKLTWPRGERSAEGATLVLRGAPGHALAAQHDAPRIATAVNRYFGFLLVREVRLSADPFTPGSGAARKTLEPDPSVVAKGADWWSGWRTTSCAKHSGPSVTRSPADRTGKANSPFTDQ